VGCAPNAKKRGKDAWFGLSFLVLDLYRSFSRKRVPTIEANLQDVNDSRQAWVFATLYLVASLRTNIRMQCAVVSREFLNYQILQVRQRDNGKDSPAGRSPARNGRSPPKRGGSGSPPKRGGSASPKRERDGD